MSYEHLMGMGTESFDMDFSSFDPTALVTTAVDQIQPGQNAVSNVFNKLGIGDQAAVDAEDVARMEAAVLEAEDTPWESFVETVQSVVSPSQAPATSGGSSQSDESSGDEPPAPWYQEYAPHMVIGGLGAGAVIVLVLAMRKKKIKDRPSW